MRTFLAMSFGLLFVVSSHSETPDSNAPKRPTKEDIQRQMAEQEAQRKAMHEQQAELMKKANAIMDKQIKTMDEDAKRRESEKK